MTDAVRPGAAEDGNGGIDLVVNGDPHTARPGDSVLDLLEALGLGGRPVAVEVNEQVVPRARLGGCMLKAGDRLEIVSLVGGG